MLTKSDLKQIRTVVQEEVQSGTKPIKADIASIKTDVSGLKKDTESLKAGQARTDKALKSIKKSLDEATAS